MTCVVSRRRVGLLLTLLVALAPLAAAQDPPQTVSLRGQVLPLTDVLARAGVKQDADAGSAGRALVTEEGKVYPLVKDAGGRMFFMDDALLRRPMRLTGRLVTGVPLLQVVAVQSERQGKVHDVYYWCDICTIRTYAPGICECCGQAIERREEPVRQR
jgi:hypothetical protein